ncbi:glycine cleavage system protein GcvH [Proteinivorax hydrogeniformans]|uniref:Glycine cleavage system H protein n=1 Tax=Proteinivorax hydrogeniformans TaxID=1826727 RepID=A0AAU8HS19_9FIRM
MSNLMYTKDHEWVKVEGNKVTVGITNHAQDQLGDVVFVELPEVDEEVEKGDDFVVIESVKAAADVYSPVEGTITEVNEDLEHSPELINEDAEGKAWIAIFEVEDTDQFEEGFMTLEEYQALIEEE